MRVDIMSETASSLSAYAEIPASFLVDRVVRVGEMFDLREHPVATPYVKDYDAIDGGGPAHWPARFDLSKWIILAAYAGGCRAGSAAVAFDAPELTSGRGDLGVLWDIRVAPAARGHGIGSALLRAAMECAASRGCRQLMAETQNVNVPACRLYVRHGFKLRAANQFAYPELPDEMQLLWYADL